jgi:hypothetical protein
MEKRNLIECEAEKTLQVMDGIGKAEVNPYLYSKILTGINEPSAVEKKFNFKFALAVFVFCLLANLVTLFSIQSINYTSEATTTSRTNIASDSVWYAQIKSLASEYSSTNNFYFY